MTEPRTTCREITCDYAAPLLAIESPEDLAEEFGMDALAIWLLPDDEFATLAREHPIEVTSILGCAAPSEHAFTVVCRLPLDVLARVCGWYYGVSPEPFLHLSEDEFDATFPHRFAPMLDAVGELSPEEFRKYIANLAESGDANAAFLAVTGRRLCPQH